MAGKYLDGLEARIIALEALPTNSKELAVVAANETTKSLEQQALDAQNTLKVAENNLAAAKQRADELAAQAGGVEYAGTAPAASGSWKPAPPKH
jgi:hypothetical protein